MPNQRYIVSRPAPKQGRIAIVTDAGWDAMDAGGACDESADPAFAKVSAEGYQTRRKLWR
jgi:hypothetical protein